MSSAYYIHKLHRIEIYERSSTDPDELIPALKQLGGLIAQRAEGLRELLDERARFSPVMRFILVDESKRTFRSPPRSDHSRQNHCFTPSSSAIMEVQIKTPLSQKYEEGEMNRFQQFLYGLHPFLLSSIAGALTVAQIALAFVFKRPGLSALKWIGWILLWAAGLLGMLPVITLRKRGGVAKGNSYMKTTKLVDSGIYAIVRHPQGGTAWLLINLGIILIAQHWTSLALGLVSMVLVYADTFKADQYCIEKFGDAYREYVERVPRVNLAAGAVRLLGRRGRS